MRIVCWNMAVTGQAGYQTAALLIPLFESWNADAVILVEPSDAMHRDQEVAPRGPGAAWRVTCFHQGGGLPADRHQGRISVATRAGVTVGRDDVLYPLADQGWFRQLLILRFVKGADSLRVATCHAPFQEGGDVVIRYARAADDEITGWERRTQHRVDAWLGDLNTAGAQQPHRGGNWQVLCARPTTARGTGSPRDKVYGNAAAGVAGGVLHGAQAGRIISRHGALDPQSPPDLVFQGWATPNDVPSDHVPVYLDKAGAAAAMPAPAAAAPAAAPRSLFAQFRQAEQRGRQMATGAPADDKMDVDK